MNQLIFFFEHVKQKAKKSSSLKILIYQINPISTELPEISVPQDEILVNNGETAVLRCNADGIPPPVISWYKGEEEVRKPLCLIRNKISSKNY